MVGGEDSLSYRPSPARDRVARKTGPEEWWLLSHPFPKKGQQLDLKALAEQVEKQTAKVK